MVAAMDAWLEAGGLTGAGPPPVPIHAVVPSVVADGSQLGMGPEGVTYRGLPVVYRQWLDDQLPGEYLRRLQGMCMLGQGGERASELGLGHGCITGDCPHEKAVDCHKSLCDYIAELLDEINSLHEALPLLRDSMHREDPDSDEAVARRKKAGQVGYVREMTYKELREVKDKERWTKGGG